jgi:hypothetical protein
VQGARARPIYFSRAAQTTTQPTRITFKTAKMSIGRPTGHILGNRHARVLFGFGQPQPSIYVGTISPSRQGDRGLIGQDFVITPENEFRV